MTKLKFATVLVRAYEGHSEGTQKFLASAGPAGSESGAHVVHEMGQGKRL